MIISRVVLKNWRNFQSVNVPTGERVFLVGPNASGKSNFLDAIRFLRDIAKPGGGLQKAVSDRGGFSKIRCLAARRYPDIEIGMELSETGGNEPIWKYSIGIKQQARGRRQPYLAYERVWKQNRLILDRPNEGDRKDELRLTQTYLEQINANAEFREIAQFFETIVYLHLVPQLVRHPEVFSGPGIPEDPFGRSLIERIVRKPEKTRRARLKKIEKALRLAVPQLKELVDTKDETGVPHLEAIYEHWRPKAGKQREDQFSDGTLRLIGLLWALLEGESTLLLEEPELSLNAGIVSQIPSMMHQLLQRKRQVILSTHSGDLLADKSIGGDETIMLIPSQEGTEVKLASSDEEVRNLLEHGLSVADVVLPRTVPKDVEQLGMF